MSDQYYPLSPYYQAIIDGFVGQSPCGNSLEYDAGFLLLQSRLQPRMEAEYGDFVEAAEPVNWNDIERDCRVLLQKSLDVRLIITLIRCRMRQHGAVELLAGLNMVMSLLLRWPDDLHPQLVDEGELDPLMRANALSELDDNDGFLADLRNLLLPNKRGLIVSIKEYERACSSPRDESGLAEATIFALQQEWSEVRCDETTALASAGHLVATLQAHLATTLSEFAPDLSRLQKILALFRVSATSEAAPDYLATAEATASSEAHIPDVQETCSADQAAIIAPEPVIPQRHIITNRHEALARIREARDWFSVMEPSSPVSLLLAFAEKITGKTFAELTRFIPMDMVSQLESDKE